MYFKGTKWRLFNYSFILYYGWFKTWELQCGMLSYISAHKGCPTTWPKEQRGDKWHLRAIFPFHEFVYLQSNYHHVGSWSCNMGLHSYLYMKVVTAPLHLVAPDCGKWTICKLPSLTQKSGACNTNASISICNICNICEFWRHKFKFIFMLSYFGLCFVIECFSC